MRVLSHPKNPDDHPIDLTHVNFVDISFTGRMSPDEVFEARGLLLKWMAREWVLEIDDVMKFDGKSGEDEDEDPMFELDSKTQHRIS